MLLIEDDESLEYSVGDTMFRYRRLSYSDRQAFTDLFMERGVLDQTAYDRCVLACSVIGWSNLLGRNGEVVFPVLGTDAERRKVVLGVVEKLPLQIALALIAKIHDPSPEEVLGNWQRQSNGNSASRTPAPDTAIPVPIAAASVRPLAS